MTEIEQLRAELEFAVPGLDRHSERMDMLLAAVWRQGHDEERCFLADGPACHTLNPYEAKQ